MNWSLKKWDGFLFTIVILENAEIFFQRYFFNYGFLMAVIFYFGARLVKIVFRLKKPPKNVQNELFLESLMMTPKYFVVLSFFP